jgi:hypothetical protein
LTDPGQDIAVARGGVRDGIAAIQNLAHLLRSARVGPRSIARAVPEVRAGCAGLRRAMVALEEAIAAEVGVDRETVLGASTVLAFAAQRATEVEELLDVQGRLETKHRLHLDAAVGVAAAELGTVLTVIELLSETARRRASPVDLGDVFDESWKHASVPSVPVTLALGDHRGFAGDPRHAAGVLELAVALVIGRRVECPTLSARRTDDGRLSVSVAAGAPGPAGRATPDGRGAHVRVPLRAMIPALAEVLPPAARHVGFDVVVEPGGRSVLVTL